MTEFTDDNRLEVVHTADIECKNDAMLQSGFSAWDRNNEVMVSWGLHGRAHAGDRKAYAALILQFGDR